MVFNNLDFDSEGMIYVLTGANRGENQSLMG